MLRCAVLFLLGTSVAAQTRVFHDPRMGVSFRYPSAWKPVELDGSLLPAVVLAGAKPVVSVGLHGLPGTTVADITFTFATAPAATEDDCRAMAKVSGFSGLMGDNPRWITLRDRRLWRVHGSDARPGLSADQVVYAAFQSLPKVGRCLLFEEDIGMVAANGGDHTLAPPPQKQMILLVTALENIIGSVQLPAEVSVAPPPAP